MASISPDRMLYPATPWEVNITDVRSSLTHSVSVLTRAGRGRSPMTPLAECLLCLLELVFRHLLVHYSGTFTPPQAGTISVLKPGPGSKQPAIRILVLPLGRFVT